MLEGQSGGPAQFRIPFWEQCTPDSGIIEIEVDGITIRAGRGADTAMIASIIQALKSSR